MSMVRFTEEQDCLKGAFQASVPIFFAYFPLGMLFAVLFVHQGYNWYWAPLISIFLFAGAVQFLILTMLENNAFMVSILIASFFVAFRNAFYGLGFIERYQNTHPVVRGLLAFGMVDATYAILISRPTASIRFCIQTTLLIYLYWQLGTLAGALFADYVPDVEGASFILSAFFMVLVLEFYLVNKSVAPLIVPVVFSIIAYLLVPSFYLVTAICLSLLFLSAKYLMQSRQEQKA